MNLARKIKQLEERITQLEAQLTQRPVVVIMPTVPVTLPTLPPVAPYYDPNPYRPTYPIITCGKTPHLTSGGLTGASGIQSMNNVQ
jgi:hypothetical protein